MYITPFVKSDGSYYLTNSFINIFEEIQYNNSFDVRRKNPGDLSLTIQNTLIVKNHPTSFELIERQLNHEPAMINKHPVHKFIPGNIPR